MIKKRSRNLHRATLFSVVATVLVLSVSGCAPQADVADDAAGEGDAAAMTEEDIAAINQVRELEAKGFSSGDAESGVRAYADDVIIMPPGEPGVNGKDAAREWLSTTYEQFDLNVNYTSADITVAGDWASEHYAGVATFTPKDGGDAVVEQMKGIHIYRRGPDGTWEITHDIWNSDAPPPNFSE